MCSGGERLEERWQRCTQWPVLAFGREMILVCFPANETAIPNFEILESVSFHLHQPSLLCEKMSRNSCFFFVRFVR